MRKDQFRAFAGVAALSLCLGLGVAAMPANVKAAEEWNWETVKNDKTFVSLTPGVNETELNFGWYSADPNDAKVLFGTSRNLTEAENLVFGGVENDEGELVGNGEEITAESTEDHVNVNDGLYSNKVTVTGLKENTTYYYSVMKDGDWTEPEEYQTKSFSDFSFLYVGDPQIGAGDEDNANEVDAGNWNNVLNQAVSNHDVSFMVSAGDQVDESRNRTEESWNNSEEQYSGYLGATALRSLPVATTIGNHDHDLSNYSYHFNNPNTFNNPNDEYVPQAYREGASAAGTDYYYTYGNVLFIVLDTNNYNCATHENVIRKAISDNPDAKWRVVTFHQDIYGAGQPHSDSDGMVLRTQLTPLMDKYNIDVVLQGHDHTYSRTYQLTGDGEQHGAYTEGQNKNDQAYQNDNSSCYELKSSMVGGTIENPEGTVYLEANSASGSKYYNLFNPVQDYIAEKSQTWTPTYSVISVTDDTFSVTTYDYESDGEELAGSSTYTIKKTEKQEELPPADDEQNVTNITNNNYNITVNKNDDNAAAATNNALKKVKGVKVANKAGNKVKVQWNTSETADGYQIQYSYKKGFKKQVKTVNVNKANKSSKVIKKMKVGKKVYVKVRAYQNVDGQKVYGNFSKVKNLTVR